MQETDQVRSLGQEDPLEEALATTPVLLPRGSHGQRSLAGYSPRGHESRTRVSARARTRALYTWCCALPVGVPGLETRTSDFRSFTSAAPHWDSRQVTAPACMLKMSVY